MTLRSRFALLAALMTAITCVGVSLFGYGLARRSVLHEVDAALTRDGQRLSRRLLANGGNLGLKQEEQEAPIAIVNGNMRVLRKTPTGAGSVNALDVEIARRKREGQFSNRVLLGKPYRFLTVPVIAGSPLRDIAKGVSGRPLRLARFDIESGGPGLALVVGREVDGVQQQLRTLATGFALLALGGTALSALAAWLTIRAATRPLGEVTRIVEAIAAEGESSLVVPTGGPPEIVALGTGVRDMLAALRESRQSQQRMIDDAAHELRTPLTSMQMNIEMLERGDRLDPMVRADITRALLNQFRELRTLVNDLGLLAEHDGERTVFGSVDFADVVTRAVDRARDRTTTVQVTCEVQSFSVYGNAERLERAIVNVLDNAMKWSPAHGTVTVKLIDGELSVIDQGPGVPVGERDRVFDRFWRSPATQSTPGSGLGLAIVADVVAAHRGLVAFSENDNGQGACVKIRLPHFRSGEESSRNIQVANELRITDPTGGHISMSN
jgi:two-component system, OmpR family, sensor histidine kinase MprB